MIVVAPTAYKEALGPVAAAKAIHSGLKSSLKREKMGVYPLSDGGDGFLECLAYYLKGKRPKTISMQVSGPLARKIRVKALVHEDRAFLESADILGLKLVPPDERDPLKTTSKGLGQAIGNLLDRGAQEVVVGLGGSSTVDGGRGALEELGVKFLDAKGEPLPSGPAALAGLAEIDRRGLDARIKRQVLILWDVDNPFLGPKGVRVYAPQKGASQEDTKILEKALSRYAQKAELAIAQRLDHRRGMGAAGGISFGFASLAGCKLMSGADFMLRFCGLRDKLRKEDVVITGEGKLDKQSLSYKVVGTLRRLPHKKLIVLCGEVAAQIAPRDRRTTAISIQPGPVDKADAMSKTREHLKQTAAQIGRLLL